MRMPSQVSVIGIAWYDRADYPRAREIMSDGIKFLPTFDEWEKLAQDTEAMAQSRGLTVIRAYIKPDDFVAWCASNGLDVGPAGRTRWGALAARNHVAGEKH